MVVARWVAIAAVLVMVAACVGGDEAVAPTTTSAPPTSTSSLAPTLPTSSTATETSTTADLALVVERVAPTEPVGGGLSWERSGLELGRLSEYRLTAFNGEVLLFAWPDPWTPDNPGAAVRRSTDGLVWSQPAEVTGLPEPLAIESIAASEHGLIGVFSQSDDDAASTGLFSSSDGVNWTKERLPDPASATAVLSAAAGPTAYAATAWSQGSQAEGGMYIRDVGGPWRRVLLPGSERQLPISVTPLEGDFVVRVGDLDDVETEGPDVNRAYRVGVDGAVEPLPLPFDDQPVPWGSRLLIWQWPYWAYGGPTEGALYAGPDGRSWQLLPIPATPLLADHEGWTTDFVEASDVGIAMAGCDCAGFWDFYGEGVVTIEVEKDGHVITVYRDLVWVHDWDEEHHYGGDPEETRTWFDDTGTMTVPDPDTGEPWLSVTCDEMRRSAEERAWGDELLTPPPQDIWFSPDGTGWHAWTSTTLFGDGSYALQGAATGDRVVLLVDPTGEAPTPDPPGCALGVYSGEQPLQLWVATESR